MSGLILATHCRRARLIRQPDIRDNRSLAPGNGSYDRRMTFEAWVEHFQDNPAIQGNIEAETNWQSPCLLERDVRAAFVRSFQRFQLGENGDGKRLLAKAREARDPVYTRALELLVAEEQRHSALFARGLHHLGAPLLTSHWSDGAFTVIRRMLGLRTEIALFLIAETVALGYFEALARSAPDPILRGIGRRILTDEVDHVRFQVDRLGDGFRCTPAVARAAVAGLWSVIAIGATAVLVLDHRGALAACGLSPRRYVGSALREFRRAARKALAGPDFTALGPSTAKSARTVDVA
jgi:hypothetical protein